MAQQEEEEATKLITLLSQARITFVDDVTVVVVAA